MQINSHNLTDKKRIDSLTGARFLAIMMIVFNHFYFLGQHGQFGEIYLRFFNNPTMGVDFFFMLSGFGMMLSSIRKDPDATSPIGGFFGLVDFGIKHIRKIYPIYVAFLVYGIPYSLYRSFCIEGLSLIQSIGKCASLFLFDLTLLQSVTGQSNFSKSLNGVCWFLSTLFCIYLVSPIIMKVIKRCIKTVKSCLICLGVCILISYLLSILLGWIDVHTFFNDLSYSSPFRRVFYVVSGMLIAKIYYTYEYNDSLCFPRFISSGAFEYVSISLSVLWFLLRVSLQSVLGSLCVIIDMIIVSCDLLALAVSRGKVSKLFSIKQIVFLGEISMYVFLSHMNVMKYTEQVFYTFRMTSFPAALIESAVILVITIITSVTIHHFRTSSGKLKKSLNTDAEKESSTTVKTNELS